MAILTKGTTFADGDGVTSTKLNNLVDAAAFVSGASGTTDDSSLEVNGSGRLQIKDAGVTAGKISSSAVTTAKLANSTTTTDGVTFPKMRYIADMRVIGNVSGGATTPSEVTILDEDDMASDSATSLASQQSIKAYVDSAPNFTPSTYAGEESVTFPNGLIMKWGTVTSTSGSDETVTFGAAFPTALVNAAVTMIENSNTNRDMPKIGAPATTGFTVWNTSGASFTFHWSAVGY